MAQIFEIFSNREIASFICLLVFFLDKFIFNKSVRASSTLLIRQFFTTQIIVLILLSSIYSGAIIYWLYVVGFWETSMIKDTCFWFAGSAFVTLMKLPRTSKESGFVTKLLTENLAFILVFEYVMNFHSFSLMWEIVLQVVLLFLILLQHEANKKNTPYIGSIINGIFTVSGIILFVVSILTIHKEIAEFASFDTLKSFLLPIILSICFVLWAYFVALYMNYELTFTRLNQFFTENRYKQYVKWRIIWKSALNIKKLRRYSIAINQLHKNSTKNEIKQTIE